VHVNCAGLPPNLIESELFGREKGAFTGASARQIGRFELAHGGTIYLDEIGELPLEVQAKLLKVIESGEFERLGSPRSIRVDVRIVASTNKDLEQEVNMGRFRRDLFYRLDVFPITIPPLNKRIEDIPLLVRFYLDKFRRAYKKQTTFVPEHTMKALQNYNWPGNVRELINVVERAVLVSDGPMLQLAERIDSLRIPASVEREFGEARESLAEMERVHILKILRETGWKIEGPVGAAATLRMKPSTLRARMKKLRIRRPNGH
jgi:transcriptional regulator with GAF, ATPase, and Fis domain